MLLFLTVCEMDESGGYCGGASRERSGSYQVKDVVRASLNALRWECGLLPSVTANPGVLHKTAELLPSDRHTWNSRLVPLWTTVTGTAFRLAVKRADLHGTDRLSAHSLRHGYAFALISQGLNVVFDSRQLGHPTPTSPSVYAHLFQHADHAATAREAPNPVTKPALARATRPQTPPTRPTAGHTQPAPGGNTSGNSQSPMKG
jgi:hypothetical protein